MRRLVLVLGWLVVAGLAAFLRFEDLAARPFHADEATGARIAAARVEGGGGRFDPKHYHGPLLGDAAVLACRLRGEDGWREMRKETLRGVTAVAGTLVVLVPWFWRRRFGDGAVLLAGAFLATSPLLVYYSRMFIHEMLLVCFGLLALAALSRLFERLQATLPADAGSGWREAVCAGCRPCAGAWTGVFAAGILLGAMYATKETFAISVLAWAGAALLTLLGVPGGRDLRQWQAWALAAWKPVVAVGVLAFFTAMILYTGCFTHPRAAVDAVRTFFVYETVAGHDKPAGWYLELLVWPKRFAGAWWHELPAGLAALAAFVLSFTPGAGVDRGRRLLVRFLGFAVLGHAVIYSMIAYKTPWLACLPWALVCLMAGLLWSMVPAGWWKRLVLAGAVVGLWTQADLARKASGRLASDARNPYAYVPTRPDVERLSAWLEELKRAVPAGMMDEAVVLGRDYWPLPWYLRGFERVGYWDEVPPDAGRIPLVVAMPEAAEAAGPSLAETHVALPRGLRAEVPVWVYVRKDVWERWMEAGP